MQGCSGSTPVCDTAAGNGVGACRACTETQGCSGSAPACDTAANGGAGVNIVHADTDQNTVSGNFIGTDVSGALALGNSGNGVIVSSKALL